MQDFMISFIIYVENPIINSNCVMMMKMKTYIVAAVIGACFCACESSDNHSDYLINSINSISPIGSTSSVPDLPKIRSGVDDDTYQRLAAFFKAELHHPYYRDGGEVFPGFFGEMEYDAQPCYLINSMEEFQTAYKGNEQLPEVDFERYSVLVGRTYRIDGSESLGIYNLVDEDDHYRMYLGILRNINPDYGYTCDIGDLFYWDLYPKRESKPINIERRVVEAVVDYAKGPDMLKYQWTLMGYFDEDGTSHQVGGPWGDERLNIRFENDGRVKGKSGNNSFDGNYQAAASKAFLLSDDVGYSGSISLTDISSTMINENDPDALYFASHIGEIEFFNVDCYYLRLYNSKGESFSFRESTLK